MTAKLALRKHDKRIASRAIQWWTNSIYSHCELVVDGWCYSSSVMDKGVRRKQISLDEDKWDIIDLPWVDAEAVVSYFKATDHHTYGWISLILSQGLNLSKQEKEAQFCSEWCARAMGIPMGSMYSPRALAEISLWIGDNFNAKL